MSKKPKVIIVMPAYNAEKTLEKTFRDIPKGLADEVILVDDNSKDNTVKVARKLGITVIEHSKNLGYGGNQKTCYEAALKKGADIVVMLHPDYQYDARLLDKLIGPIKDDGYDMMFGSRIRTRKEALAGGMPKIKYFLNRIITPIENIVLGVNFSEHLSGLRAYHKRLLKKVPFKQFSNDFVFDQQMMASAVSYGFKISETPIPVRYFSESSSIKYIKGAKFLISTFLVLLQFTLHNLGVINVKYINTKKKKMPLFFLYIAILAVVFLSYGQTINMYFWQDDSALIFKLQNIDVGAGSFGSGWLGRDGLYKYLVTPFVPLYPFFGLNASWYFFGGVIMYFISAVSVFYLGKAITKNRKVAFFGALIYSAGYIGSDTMWRIINSYQTAIAVVLLSLSTITYKKYTEKKSIFLYLVAFMFFLVTLEVGFIRGHGIIFIIAALEAIYNFDRYSIFRTIPFVGLYYRYYLLGNVSSSHLRDYFSLIFSKQFFETISVPVETFKNAIIPDLIKINGWLVLTTIMVLGILKRNREILFLSVFVFANFVTYIIHYPDQTLASTHRYLTTSFAGSSVLISLIFYNLFEKRRLYGKMCAVVILSLLTLVNIEEYRIVNERSLPAKRFYSALKNEIPEIGKGSELFFDVRQDGKSQIEFGNFFGVGSMPETTAIAIYYGIDRYDLEMTQSFREFASKINERNIKPEKIYSFYYSTFTGLKNTTKQVREELFGHNDEKVVNNMNEINLHRISPVIFTFTPEISFSEYIPNVKHEIIVGKYLNYLESRNKFYSTSVASTSSEWKYQERRYIIDKNPLTAWRGHRMYWHYEKHEEVELDLKDDRSVSAVRIFNGTVTNSPSAFTIYCFNSYWKRVLGHKNQIRSDGEITTVKFPSHICSRLKIDVTSTIGGDSPEIADIEVVETGYEDINIDSFMSFLNDPLAQVQLTEQNQIRTFIQDNGWEMDVCATLNNSDSENNFCRRVLINPGTETNFLIRPGGTILRSLTIKPITGTNVKILNPHTKILSLNDLSSIGYFQEYHEN